MVAVVSGGVGVERGFAAWCWCRVGVLVRVGLGGGWVVGGWEGGRRRGGGKRGGGRLGGVCEGVGRVREREERREEGGRGGVVVVVLTCALTSVCLSRHRRRGT